MEQKYAEEPDVVFVHLQTVFEGASANTPERGPKEAAKYEIAAPVGYDARLDGSRLSLFMVRYGTGGTPWTVVIDRKGIVRFSAVTPGNRGRLQKLVNELLEEPGPAEPGSDEPGR